MLGLATYWQSLLDEGKFTSLTEIARAEGIDRAYVSRVFKLTRVSPVIVEQALADKVTMEALMAMGGVGCGRERDSRLLLCEPMTRPASGLASCANQTALSERSGAVRDKTTCVGNQRTHGSR